MKIYELIRELCGFDADCEVEISCKLNGTEVEIEEEDKKSETSVLVHFEDTTDIDIECVREGHLRKEKCYLVAYFN